MTDNDSREPMIKNNDLIARMIADEIIAEETSSPVSSGG